MNTELERIEAEALKLPVEDREHLAERLLASLDGLADGDERGPAFATPELKRIEADALKLSADDREHLVEVLIDSLNLESDPVPGDYGGFASAEIQKSSLDEAERRMQLLREGRTKTYSAEEVFAEARAQLKAAREIR